MFRNNFEHDPIKRAISHICERASSAPFVPPSPDDLNAAWVITNVAKELRMQNFPENPQDMVPEELREQLGELPPEILAMMQAPLTKEQVLEMEKAFYNAMPEACEMAMDSPSFDQLIRSLDLNQQKIQLLSIRKLGTLLTLEIGAGGPIPTPPPVDVANLFSRLDDIGVSFEMLAALSDKKFEAIVQGATTLIELANEGLPLNNLHNLSYFQIKALSLPPFLEHEMITRNREEAMDLLSAAHPQPGH